MKTNGTSDDADGSVVGGLLGRVRLTIDPGLVLLHALRFLDGHNWK